MKVTIVFKGAGICRIITKCTFILNYANYQYALAMHGKKLKGTLWSFGPLVAA